MNGSRVLERCVRLALLAGISAQAALAGQPDPDLRHLKPVQRLEAGSGVAGVAISPDGARAATFSDQAIAPFDRTIQLWDLRTGSRLRTLSENKRPLRASVFSPDGRMLATTALDGPSGSGDTCLWKVSTSELLARIEEGGETVRFSRDGARVEIPTGHQVRWYDALTGAELRRLENRKWGLAFARDGQRLLARVRRRDPRLFLLDVESGRQIVALQAGATEPLAIALSEDARTVAIESGENGIGLWEVASGQLVRYLRGMEHRVFCLAFSPGGQFLACGGVDRTVRIWDVATGRELARGEGHQGRVAALAFSAAGDRLLSAGADGTVLVWTTPSVGPPADEPLDEAAFNEFWRDLGSARSRAYAAIGQIQRRPSDLLPWVLDRLGLYLLRSDDEQIESLIADLDDPSHRVRAQATEQLRRLHPSHLRGLARTLEHADSNETRLRLQRILRRNQESMRVSATDVRRVQRIIHALEALPLAESRPVLELLAEHFPNHEVAADARDTLERIQRRAPAQQ